jgi:hypothetical protein
VELRWRLDPLPDQGAGGPIPQYLDLARSVRRTGSLDSRWVSSTSRPSSAPTGSRR